MNAPASPLQSFLSRQPAIVLDGGLATALEARGCTLDDELWSARILLDDPGLIRRVHLDYLDAGADCITTASYQASLPGFRARGLSDADGEALLQLSVRLACDARDGFWRVSGNRAGRQRPLVAAGVGPYGAYLADGSEYTGDYGVDDDTLREFHRRRLQVLAAGDANLLACETIPSRQEVMVLLDLLRDIPDVWAWMSVSCRDGERLCDGTPLVEIARLCDAEEHVAAVGVNCTPPRFIDSLIVAARAGTTKPIIVYPNSGERYDAVTKTWKTLRRPRTGMRDAAGGWRRVRWGSAGAAGWVLTRSLSSEPQSNRWSCNGLKVYCNSSKT